MSSNPFLNYNLSDISDVKVNNISPNVLGNIPLPLSSCIDVSLSNIANSQQLVYDSATSQWKNATVSTTTMSIN